MAPKKALHRRVAGLVKIGSKALFIRSLDLDGIPKTPFHLPSVGYPEGNLVKELQEAFELHLGCRVAVYGSLIPVTEGKEQITLFYCEEITPVRFPTENFESLYAGEKEFGQSPIIKVDEIAAEKGLLYLPLLKGTKRQKALSPLECDKIITMFESFSYFDTKIPEREVEQFERLVNSNISYEGILKAYRFLLNEFGANYYEFADLIEHVNG